MMASFECDDAALSATRERRSESEDEGLHSNFVDALKANDAVQPTKMGKLMAHVPTPNLKKAVTRNLKSSKRKERENIKGKVIDAKAPTRAQKQLLELGVSIFVRNPMAFHSVRKRAMHTAMAAHVRNREELGVQLERLGDVILRLYQEGKSSE